MAALAGRVLRLERRAGVGTACERCGGAGVDAYQLLIDGQPVGGPPRGCAACGKIGVLHQTVIDVDGGEAPEQEPTPCA